MGGVGLQPALCLVWFSTLAVGMQLFKDLSFFGQVFKSSGLCLGGAVAVTCLGQSFLVCKQPFVSCDIRFAWSFSLGGDTALLCPWNVLVEQQRALAWPQGLGKLYQQSGESEPPSHCCQLPCPRSAMALAKPGPLVTQSWNWLKTSL